MPRLTRSVPKYCKHRASGQAVGRKSLGFVDIDAVTIWTMMRVDLIERGFPRLSPNACQKSRRVIDSPSVVRFSLSFLGPVKAAKKWSSPWPPCRSSVARFP